MAVPYRHTTFTRPSGAQLVCHLWEPPAATRTVWIIHGFAEHGGRYAPVAEEFAAAGLATVCLDLWGHGRSAGRRGDVTSYEEYLDDLELLRLHLRSAWTAPEVSAVFAHSFGGTLGILWALRHPELSVLALQSPLLELGFPIVPWKDIIQAKLTSVWPGLALPLGTRVDWLTQDTAIARAYQQDPLVHHWITLQAFREMQRAMRAAREQGSQLWMPTQLFWGAEDNIISTTACRAFAERLPGEKRVREFAGCRHELHHEPVKREVVELTRQWIVSHGA